MPVKTKSKKNKGNRTKPGQLTAKTADKLMLYELSVQEPEADVDFIDATFKQVRGRKALSLREDFCGTAKLCADWVKSDELRTAKGLDLDQPTLDWGMANNIGKLKEGQDRVELLCRNVLDGLEEAVDVTVAFNFSYWCFYERQQLVDYFRSVREGLKDDGVFFLDIHGGPDAQCEAEEEEKKDPGFTYIWDQGTMDAVTGRTTRKIHFRFKDGSEIKNAFVYEWRVWNLTEVKDILADAGFPRIEVYWEGADDNGEGDGNFELAESAENEECWIAYLAAWKNR